MSIRFSARAPAGHEAVRLLALTAQVAAVAVLASCFDPEDPVDLPDAAVVACSEAEGSRAAAAVVAGACGHRVEDLSGRTESTQVFANPDGTSTMEIAAVPQRVRRADGSWTPVDTALLANLDGSWSPAATTVDLQLSGGGTAPLVTLTRGDRQFTMSWPRPLPAPEIAGDTATYAEVLPGVDLMVQATVTGYSHVLSVKTAEAAANPALRRIEYLLGGTGVDVIETPEGGVSVVGDDDGEPILVAGGAAMWDSFDGSAAGPGDGAPTLAAIERSTAWSAGERARTASVPSKVAADRLVLEPDAAMLARGPHPVFVDPAFITPGAMRWAYSNSGNENNETSVARVGLSPESGRIYRSYFEFPMSHAGRTLYGSTISSATFSIVLYHTWSCGATPVTLWRTAGIASTPRTAWVPTALQLYLDTQWGAANKDSCHTPNTPTLFFGGKLTGDLQSAVNNSWFTYVVGLSAANSGGGAEGTASHWKKFFPGTALLTVNFNHAPNTPAATDLSIAPSSPCGSAPIHVNATNGVTLRAQLSDSDVENVAAQWQVNGIPAEFAPGDSGFAAAGTFSTTIPAAAFTDGGSYSWTVRATDGTHAGAYAPACPFVVNNSPPGIPTASSSDLALGTGLIVPAPPPTAVVGATAAVTLSPATGDAGVAGYLIGVGAGVQVEPSVWVPARADGTAPAPIVPVAPDGTLNFLTVRARDLTGQTGATAAYRFRAAPAAGSPRVRGDATGDGRTDVVTLGDVGGGNGVLWRWTTAASGTSAMPTAPQDVATTHPLSSVRRTQGDFDGDGLADVALLRQQGSDVAVSIQRSDRNGLLGIQVATLAGWNVASIKPLAGNFDGDAAGRDDLALFHNDGSLGFSVRVLLATGSVAAPSFAGPTTWHVNPPGSADWTLAKPFAGDFDGDGRADFAHIYQYPSCQTRMWAHFSTGSTLGPAQMLWDSTVNNWCWDRSEPVVADYDNDSRSDIALLYRYDGCQSGLWAFYGNANRTLASTGAISWMSGVGTWCADRTELAAGDLDRDGRADVGALYRFGGYLVKLYRFSSTGRGFNAPVEMYEGSLGPIGTFQ